MDERFDDLAAQWDPDAMGEQTRDRTRFGGNGRNRPVNEGARHSQVDQAALDRQRRQESAREQARAEIAKILTRIKSRAKDETDKIGEERFKRWVAKVLKGGELLSEDELLEEFIKGSGPGGQNVNKRKNTVQLTHLPTLVTTTISSERSQGQNREVARRVLTEKLQVVASQIPLVYHLKGKTQ